MQPKAYCKGCFPGLRITILLITALLTFSSKSVAQKVTINRTNVSLEVVFKEIRKQTGYSFIYRNEWIQKLGKISINVKDAALSEVMDICLEGRQYTYNIENKIITIYPVAEKKETSEGMLPVAEDSLIYGKVDNAAGIPLVGVSITNMTRKASQRITAVSRADGSFEIVGNKGDKLQFTIIGYGKTAIKFIGGQSMNVSMQEEALDLNTVEISNLDFSHKRIPWTDTIDMKFRSHLNLGQVLQGTIPGLTLQNSSQSQTIISSLDWGSNATLYGKQISSLADLRKKYNEQIGEGSLPPNTSFEEFLNSIVKQGYKLNYSTTVNNNGLIPQLRGVSGFSGNTSGMLIVIDGFPQDGFPADYPMTNVASVKVIKDPETLTRWGPRAAGGVILITSKRGEVGKLRWGYNTNFYYAPKPRFDRSKQRLATSGDILDYLKDASDSGFIFTSPDPSGRFLFNKPPAELLLYKLSSGTISQDRFKAQWDSLGGLSNEGQLGLLQQDVVNQNHMLTLSGGSTSWRFNAAGSYSTSRTNALNNYNRNIGLSMFNNFLLFNNKLRADWNIRINSGRSRQGTSVDPATLQPYQLLLDPGGRYIYDYTSFNPEANTVLVNAGYNNYGVNLLQDARLNSNISKMLNAESQLNMDWELLPGLRWSGSFQYINTNSNSEDYQDAESSRARQLVDDFASPLFNTVTTDANRKLTGITFHVPKGGIFRRSFSSDKNWNARSGLLYNKKIGKHDLSLALGGSGSSTMVRVPAYNTIYGYNPQTGKGQLISLPFDPLSSVGNYLQLPGVYGLYGDADPNTIYPVFTANFPHTLLAPGQESTTIQRQLGWNGRVKYNFNDTYILKGDYNAVFNPSYGYNPPYSMLANYNAEATWRLYKLPFFHPPVWMSELSLSAGITGVEIPALPTEIGGTRTLQTAWNNYGIWVGNYNLAQQTGQRVQNIYQKLTIGLAANSLMLDLVHGAISIKGNEKVAGTNSTNDYIGANVRANLRKGLLNLIASYGRSPEGEPQTNLRAGYNIAGETYFHVPAISSLNADFILQQISPYQAMGLMMETNTPKADGAYTMAINNNFGLLPPKTSNMEAHATIGLLDDRYQLDFRYYRKVVSGLNNSIPVPTDPSTGLGARISYSEIVSKGIELYLMIKVVQQEKFRYVITLNGAYNKNMAQHVPLVNYSQTPAYLMAYRNDYSTESSWGYRWAGLDANGNPQIYDEQGKKTATPDSATLASALVYNGVTRAPYNGGLIQEWNVSDFFARATIAFKLGHVMRQYIPSPSGALDNSSLIRDRWRKPGDEQYTDIAAMANTNATDTRAFIIQNSTNSILPADNIRLQEIQIGWQAPKKLLKDFFIKDLTLSFQAQNLIVWKRNKLQVDPEIVSSGGQIGMPMSKQYSFSINMNF